MLTNEYKEDVTAHIKKVSDLLLKAAEGLRVRAAAHDQSKFSSEEFPIYSQVVPKLKTLEYGSDEYKETIKELGPALAHHYQENSHHPEHYEDGVNDMDLFDLMEMLCDWIAVSPDIVQSMLINKNRFDIRHQLFGILQNTVNRMTEGEHAND